MGQATLVSDRLELVTRLRKVLLACDTQADTDRAQQIEQAVQEALKKHQG